MIWYNKQIIKFQLDLASPPSVTEVDRTITKEVSLRINSITMANKNKLAKIYKTRLSYIQHNSPFLWVASAVMDGQGSNLPVSRCHFLLWNVTGGKSQQRCTSTGESIGLSDW